MEANAALGNLVPGLSLFEIRRPWKSRDGDEHFMTIETVRTRSEKRCLAWEKRQLQQLLPRLLGALFVNDIPLR